MESFKKASCRRVASRPISKINRPVAIGSKVPLCPIFLVFKMRREMAIMSCEEKSAGLSSNNSPLFCGSADIFDDIIHHLSQLVGYFVDGFAGYFKPGSPCMPAAAERLGDFAYVHPAARA